MRNLWPGVGIALTAFILSGCAYVTVTPVTAANRDTAKGLRVFSPKPYVVVNGTGVSAIYLPDCAKEYALQFGAVLAKNDVSLELQNGMVSKLDSKLDSTSIASNILSAVTEATKAGRSLGTAFSTKAAGGTDTLTVFETSCVGDRLVLTPLDQIRKLPVVSGQPTVPDDDGDDEAGTPPPGKP